jgi:hypothetical protein
VFGNGSSVNVNLQATGSATTSTATSNVPPKPSVRSSLQNKEPTFLSSQKRVSFTVASNEDTKAMTANPNNNNNIISENQESRSLDSATRRIINQQQQQQLKPLIICKQKPLPKLGSLYTTQEIINTHQQDENPSSNSVNPVIKGGGSINNQSLITPTPTPLTSANNATNNSVLPALNRLDLFKNSSILPSYHHPNQIITANSNMGSNASSNIVAGYDVEPGTNIEITRLYSASKVSKSVSTNDLSSSSSKSFKLPPVVQNNSSSGTNSNILIGGSNNNLNSIGLTSENSTNVSTKKKITDLSRYCYFCRRKTGLASSYICRYFSFSDLFLFLFNAVLRQLIMFFIMGKT